MSPDPEVERKKVQLAAKIIEIEEKSETCKVELNFKSGKLVDGKYENGFLK